MAKGRDDPPQTLNDAPTVMGAPRIASRGAPAAQPLDIEGPTHTGDEGDAPTVYKSIERRGELTRPLRPEDPETLQGAPRPSRSSESAAPRPSRSSESAAPRPSRSSDGARDGSRSGEVPRGVPDPTLPPRSPASASRSGELAAPRARADDAPTLPPRPSLGASRSGELSAPRPASASVERAFQGPPPRRSEARFIGIVAVVLALGLASLAAWVTVARPSSARAPSSAIATARAYRDTAFAHFRAGRSADAVAALERGDAAHPHPNFLLDLALVHAAWDGHCPDALAALRRLDARCADCGARPELRPHVDGVYARCAVEVMIDSTPVGATIHIDGRPEGTTPGMLHVAPGEHDIVLELEGYQRLVLEKVPMQRGQRPKFTFELVKVGG